MGLAKRHAELYGFATRYRALRCLPVTDWKWSLAMACFLVVSCKTYDPTQVQHGSTSASTQGQVPGSTSNDDLTLVGTTSSSQSTSTQSPQKPSETVGCTVGDQIRCKEDALGQVVQFPGGFPRGNCRYGEKSCLAQGEWGVCRGVIAPAPRDDCSVLGDDSNCNGAPNDGCDCLATPDAKRACGTNVGTCSTGIQRCVNGSWGQCQDEVKPRAELCDGQGLDEDCDGLADLDDPDCDCIHGRSIQCRVAGGVGDCALGERKCTKGHFGPCVALRKPTREKCGKGEPDIFGRATGDEDCDGAVDEENGPEPPLGCRIFMEDRDDDSWGRIGPSFIEDPLYATYGCFCNRPPPRYPNFILAIPGRENKDCGDCWGESLKVKPTQHDFFSVPSDCLLTNGWKGGPFDYNCDGVGTPYRPNIHKGTCVEHSTKEDVCIWSDDSSGDWVDEVPGCGEKGPVPRCFNKGESGNRECVVSSRPEEHWQDVQSCN